jgi:hypothetical protein
VKRPKNLKPELEVTRADADQVLGLVFSLPLAFSGLMAPDNPEFSKATIFIR